MLRTQQRTLCQWLYNENDTNFRYVERNLRQMFRTMSKFYERYRSKLDKKRIDWTFIASSARHFGELRKAGIKSTIKYHLHRVIGDQMLTRDNFCTLLSKVEACLKIRSTSNDPSDLTVITSGLGHFLVGESLISLPESGEAELPRNYKQYLELLYSLRNSF